MMRLVTVVFPCLESMRASLCQILGNPVLVAVLLSVLAGVACASPLYAQEDSHATTPSSLQEVWQVGSPDDDVLFGGIRSLTIDSRGRVYVADWGHAAVYVFSGSGEGSLVREIGSRGEGPGEFRSVTSVFVGAGDSVFVFDSDADRISLFSPENYDFVGSLRVVSRGNSYPYSMIGVVPGGILLSYGRTFLDGANNQANRFRDAYLVNRKTGQQETPSPIVSIWNSGIMVHASRDGGYAMRSFPFRVVPHMYLSSRNRMYFSQGEANVISVYSEEGLFLDSLRWSRDLVPITSSELRNALREQSDRWRRVIQDMGVPEFKPAVQNFVVDDQENIWVQMSPLEGASAATCIILDADGNQLTSLELPSNLRLRAIRDGNAYGVLRMEDDTDVLIAYRIL